MTKKIQNINLIEKTFEVEENGEITLFSLTDEQVIDLNNWMSLSINKDWEIEFIWTRILTEQELKEQTKKIILSKYPYYKQHNLSTDTKSKEYKEMRKFIDEERKKCNDKILKLKT